MTSKSYGHTLEMKTTRLGQHNLLDIDKLNCSYGKMQVLWNTSIQVSQGQICSIVGSKGAGKSTLLRAISGLVRVNSGTITFLDEEITNLKPHEIASKGIAHVPEGKGLFSTLTVEENLRIGAYLPQAKKAINESLSVMFSLFPVLKERRNQIVRTLSGGEQQMLSVARGLMSKPQLLMLDDPSAGLMPKLIPEIFKIITNLKKQGITLLLVEQNVHRALEISDQAYVIENGNVTLQGTKEELLHNKRIQEAYLGVSPA